MKQRLLIFIIFIGVCSLCFGESKSNVIACGPFPHLVSSSYPFSVYNKGERGVRLILRSDKKDEQKEYIIGTSGQQIIEIIDAGKNPKTRLLSKDESKKLIVRLDALLMKHHGQDIMVKLKQLLLANEGATDWIFKRKDSDDIVATVCVIDAIMAMKTKQAEQVAAPDS